VLSDNVTAADDDNDDDAWINHNRHRRFVSRHQLFSLELSEKNGPVGT